MPVLCRIPVDPGCFLGAGIVIPAHFGVWDRDPGWVPGHRALCRNPTCKMFVLVFMATKAAVPPTAAVSNESGRIGASCVKRARPVPTSALEMVSATTVSADSPEAAQRSDVDVDHAEVMQAAEDTVADGVKSPQPKCSPRTDSVAPPVTGVLRTARESTGESNVKTSTPVETTRDTVTATTLFGIVVRGTAHLIMVLEIQTEEPHATKLMRTLVDKSCSAKLRPLTVISTPPVRGVFDLACETTGASNESVLESVATRPPMVIGAMP